MDLDWNNGFVAEARNHEQCQEGGRRPRAKHSGAARANRCLHPSESRVSLCFLSLLNFSVWRLGGWWLAVCGPRTKRTRSFSMNLLNFQTERAGGRSNWGALPTRNKLQVGPPQPSKGGGRAARGEPTPSDEWICSGLFLCQ